LEDEKESAKIPELSEINWISYDLKAKKPEKEQQYFLVRPDGGDVPNSLSFKEVMSKFNSYI
jgi:hypothetical protein